MPNHASCKHSSAGRKQGDGAEPGVAPWWNGSELQRTEL